MSLKLIVLFTGSGSTGKTTLLNKFKSDFEYVGMNCSFITGFVRDLIKQGIIGEVDINASNHNQVVITSELMCQFWEKLQDSNSLVISERCPIDTLAYSRNRKDSTEYVNKLNERFLTNVFNYKDVKFLVFYFPPILPFEEDNIRNKEGQRVVDEEIKRILEEFKIDYIPVDISEFEERYFFILKTIKEKFSGLLPDLK